jgi:hypothetical protein
MLTREDILANRRSDSIIHSAAATELTGTAIPGVKWADSLKKNKAEDDLRTKEAAIIATRQRERQSAEERRGLLKRLQGDADRWRH